MQKANLVCLQETKVRAMTEISQELRVWEILRVGFHGSQGIIQWCCSTAQIGSSLVDSVLELIGMEESVDSVSCQINLPGCSHGFIGQLKRETKKSSVQSQGISEGCGKTLVYRRGFQCGLELRQRRNCVRLSLAVRYFEAIEELNMHDFPYQGDPICGVEVRMTSFHLG